MRIANSARTERAGQAANGKRAGRTGSGFSLSTAEDSKASAGPRSAAGIAGVDALIAIQGVGQVGDATSGKARAMRRGHSMLDTLEELKLDLLAGQISEAKLEKLLRLVKEKGGEKLDPALSGVLDEIELRARVELAKHARH